jgi:hypothetical protein
MCDTLLMDNETDAMSVVERIDGEPFAMDERPLVTQFHFDTKLMVADVVREGAGEFVDSKEARGAIGKRTVELFKAHLKDAQ